MFALALVFFVVATGVAYSRLPEATVDLNWTLLGLVIVIGTVTAVVTNALEFAVLASLLGHGARPAEAVRVSILSSAANLLPIPGSVVVRFRALRRKGATAREISLGIGVVGLVFLAVTGLLAGGLIFMTEDMAFGAALSGIGAVVLVIGLALAHRLRGCTARRLVMLTLVETASVGSLALRMLLILIGMNLSVSAGQVMAVTAGGVAGVAVAVVPAGLGIREVVAGAFSPLVELPVAVGVFSGALDRILTSVGMIVVTLAVLLLNRRAGVT